MGDGAMERVTAALAEYLATGGQAGTAPEWWETLQAARYLMVGPWELERATVTRQTWRDRALCALRAENAARQLQAVAAARLREAQQGRKLLVPM